MYSASLFVNQDSSVQNAKAAVVIVFEFVVSVTLQQAHNQSGKVDHKRQGKDSHSQQCMEAVEVPVRK